MLAKIHSKQAIGVFDSGVGGLTVMRRLSELLPHENLVYFGDTARVPYGGKSRDTIIKYSIENTIFLLGHDIKALVVACNTASSCALEKLQQVFKIPVIGTIEPAIEKAVEISQNGHIAVLGTKATVNSEQFQIGIKSRRSDAVVSAVPCPLLVPLVEECFVAHPATRLVVREYLSQIKDKQIDTLILACTHYPLLRQLIAEELPGVQIVDSAVACAEKVESLLVASELHNSTNSSSSHKYFVSDDPEKFRKLGTLFLGMSIDHVEAASHL